MPAGQPKKKSRTGSVRSTAPLVDVSDQPKQERADAKVKSNGDTSLRSLEHPQTDDVVPHLTTEVLSPEDGVSVRAAQQIAKSPLVPEEGEGRPSPPAEAVELASAAEPAIVADNRKESAVETDQQTKPDDAEADGERAAASPSALPVSPPAASSTVSEAKAKMNGEGGPPTPPPHAPTAAAGTKNGMQFSTLSLASDWRCPFIWLDLEMTGLDIQKDVIIEIAVVVSEGDLSRIVEGPNIVINASPDQLAGMSQFVANMHQRSGLTTLVTQSTSTVHDAEGAILQFLASLYVPPKIAPLAGNSPFADRLFLTKYMPNLEQYISFRTVDVTSVRLLADAFYALPPYRKQCEHRAMADVRESIAELQYYRERIFRSRSLIDENQHK